MTYQIFSLGMECHEWWYFVKFKCRESWRFFFFVRNGPYLLPGIGYRGIEAANATAVLSGVRTLKVHRVWMMNRKKTLESDAMNLRSKFGTPSTITTRLDEYSGNPFVEQVLFIHGRILAPPFLTGYSSTVRILAPSFWDGIQPWPNTCVMVLRGYSDEYIA